jgi:GTP pyrophosphokinase
MHEEAEYGIYSHVGYKETNKGIVGGATHTKTHWTKELLEAQRTMHKPEDFLSHLKLDFFTERVFVYTPQGDVIELPKGACVIDFAYAIHSDIGNHIFGAKINGKWHSFTLKFTKVTLLKSLPMIKINPTENGWSSAKLLLLNSKLENISKNMEA